jgi:transcriptional regulator with XRE-family HTH domain
MMPVTEDTIDLRAQRRGAGLSQEAVARAVGCSTGSIRLLESGYRPATSPLLERLVAYWRERSPLDEERPDWAGRVVLTASPQKKELRR